MHHTLYTLAAACLAIAMPATGQHVPEYRLRGTSGTSTKQLGADPSTSVGNYPLEILTLDDSSFTLRFFGTMTTASNSDSSGNWHLKNPQFTSGSVTSSKTRTGETQFVTFLLDEAIGGDPYNVVRIDRGNVNADGRSGIVETLFLFETYDDKLTLVRTKAWDETVPAWNQGIPPASQLCSLSEKVFEKKKNPKCGDLTFPKTTYDLMTWNMGFENSQNVATNWNGSNWADYQDRGGDNTGYQDRSRTALHANAKQELGEKLGYPFLSSACMPDFNGGMYDLKHGKNTTSKWPDSNVTVGHWSAEFETEGESDKTTWSVGLDGKWKGIPTAFQRSSFVYDFNNMDRQQMTINAKVEPYELTDSDNKVLKKRELFPHQPQYSKKLPHFPKCPQSSDTF